MYYVLYYTEEKRYYQMAEKSHESFLVRPAFTNRKAAERFIRVMNPKPVEIHEVEDIPTEGVEEIWIYSGVSPLTKQGHRIDVIKV